VLDSGAKGYVLKSDAIARPDRGGRRVRSNKTFLRQDAQAVFDRQIKRMSDHAKKPPDAVRKEHTGT